MLLIPICIHDHMDLSIDSLDKFLNQKHVFTGVSTEMFTFTALIINHLLLNESENVYRNNTKC